MKLLGPFNQVMTMRGLPLKGALKDKNCEVIPDAGILVEKGRVVQTASFKALRQYYKEDIEIIPLPKDLVALPGFTDSHTHIAFGGSRAADYSKRLSGISYLEIARQGGGIWHTVQETRNMSTHQIVEKIVTRATRSIASGITTMEVKSGYGLELETEIRILKAIALANKRIPSDLVATCLAAHTKPPDFAGNKKTYLDWIIQELAPIIKDENLAGRMDIFVEEEAFSVDEAAPFLRAAKTMGFDLTVHGDQFTTGGSALAVSMGAVSVDHLEVSGDAEIEMLSASGTVATVLPGASLGLGMPFAPARKLLDKGAIVAFGSDWNPGSAPMGDLLTEVSLLAAYERLTMTEIFAGITFRAAHSLRVLDRGRLIPGHTADIAAFPCQDYREILYHQGTVRPTHVWKKGLKVL